MSGGKFDYYDTYLCNDIFGYEVDVVYGIGDQKQKKYARMARRKNPLKDSIISELVYDVFCLLHSFDWSESGDTSEDDYERDINAFKDKWVKLSAKKLAERTITNGLQDLEERLRRELGLNEPEPG